jgi:Zn-dependent protease with chaperone function
MSSTVDRGTPSDGVRPGDAERLRIVLEELRKLANGEPLPAVELTDALGSSADKRSQLVVISRRSIDNWPRTELSAVVAHEHSHVLDPDPTWRRAAFAALAGLLVIAGLVASVGAVAAALLHRPWPLGLVSLPIGAAMFGGAAGCWARAFHVGELRADARAAELLGGPAPVLAWLDRMQHTHERLDRKGRLEALMTHPSPARRKRALVEEWRARAVQSVT